MILYIILAVLTAGLGFLVNNHYVKQSNTVTRQQMLNYLSLVSVFLLLFGVCACRLNVGNDYAKYVEFMHLIECNAYVPTEFGFNWIVKALYAISGYENYLLVFAFLPSLPFCFLWRPSTGRQTPLVFPFSFLWPLAIIFNPLTQCVIIWP